MFADGGALGFGVGCNPGCTGGLFRTDVRARARLRVVGHPGLQLELRCPGCRLRSVLVSSPRAVVRAHDLPGDGVPLVFVHGLECASSCDYPRVICDCALSRRRSVLIDLLGSGFSDRPMDFEYSIQAHAVSSFQPSTSSTFPCCTSRGHLTSGLAGQTVSRHHHLITPHRFNRKIKTRDGFPLRRYTRRWKAERRFASSCTWRSARRRSDEGTDPVSGVPGPTGPRRPARR